jgi:hypothetical protein
MVPASTSSSIPTTTASTVGSASSAGSPPAVPATGAYLGAWVHPVDTSGGSSFGIEDSALPSFQTSLGRPLGIVHVYAGWQQPAPVADLQTVAAAGSIPLLDWACGPSVGQVAAGDFDSQIEAYALALKSFGGPVFLRWCWEMNLVASHPGIDSPAQFVAAWTHVWTIFHQVGVTNVAFVWCPALSGADPAPYYPGAQYVDWIGVDGYDRSGTATFASLFGAYVSQWQGQGKPLMVAETGASGSSQAAFVQSIGTDMPGLPSVKAVVYFDAVGPEADWRLVGTGLGAFGALARDPYFSPR